MQKKKREQRSMAAWRGVGDGRLIITTLDRAAGGNINNYSIVKQTML